MTLFLVLLSVSSFAGEEREADPMMGHAPLSTEFTQMLEQIKIGVEAYDTQLKSGEIEFSVTLFQKHIPVGETENFNFLSKLSKRGWDTLKLPKEIEDANIPTYDVSGYWYITYQFSGDTHFYDVKAHKKQEIDRHPVITETEDGYSTDIWQKTHYQFLIRNKTMFIRDGTVWKPINKLTIRDFDKRFNPRWWRLPTNNDNFEHSATFDKFIHPDKTVGIKIVQIDGTPYYHLKLYSQKKIYGNDTTFTRHILMDPQKDFQMTRMVSHERITEEIKDEGRFWPLPLIPPHTRNIEMLAYNVMTWQHAQYEPGIWFPKTVTQKDFHPVEMSEIFPDVPISEYPAIISEELLPKWFREEYLLKSYRQSFMRVHRAVFNIPVEIKPKPVDPSTKRSSYLRGHPR